MRSAILVSSGPDRYLALETWTRSGIMGARHGVATLLVTCPQLLCDIQNNI
jgi:hypothetical protein